MRPTTKRLREKPVSILSDFEERVGRAVEGMFAGVFRSPVQPAELARACAKEMDRRRKVGVGKMYAPTLYNVLLSPADDQQLGGFEETLAGELETYLVGYARERSYVLAARPVVRFLIDSQLKLGRFEVIGELLSPEELAEEVGGVLGDEDEYEQVEAAPAPVTPAPIGGLGELARSRDVDETTVFKRPKSAGLSQGHLATLTIRGIDHDVVLRGDRLVIGRLNSCDICLQDGNASRRHAELVAHDDGWAIEDLGSTNGTLLNGHAVDSEVLEDGDVITVGITELVYHEPRGD